MIEQAKGAETCRTAGASSLSVVSVPLTSAVRAPEVLTHAEDGAGRVEPSVPDRRLAQSCERHGIPFSAMAPELGGEHYWRRDMHWNAAGHGVAADVIHRDRGARRALIGTRGAAQQRG